MFASKGSSGNQPSKGKGPAWLGSRGGKGTKKAAAGWKPSEAKPQDPESRQRGIRMAVGAAAVLLVAVFLYFLLTRPQATPLVMFRATAYPLQMPPLALAQEDEHLLEAISRNLRVMPAKLEAAGSLEGFRTTLADSSRRFNPLQWGVKAALVYVAAHGVVDESGRACLVPPSGDPFDSSTWLPLENVLEAVSKDAGLKGRDKVILLDCQRVWSCWRCGWLENRFFDALGAAVKKQDDSRLFVLTSAGRGEIAWAAPELRGSIFGHFVAKGLRGEAAGRGRTVSLDGLYKYVASEVQSYAAEHRGVSQTPRLLHLASSFRLDEEGNVTAEGGSGRTLNVALCYVDQARRRSELRELQSEFDPIREFQKTVGTSDRTSAAGGQTTTLTKVWQLYHDRSQGRAATSNSSLPGYVVDPVAWSSIQQRLAAVGERLLAGEEYQARLQADIDLLASELAPEKWQVQGRLPQLSVLQVKDADDGTRQSARANSFAAYVKAEPDKRAEAIPKGLSRSQAVRDVYAELSDASQGGDARGRLALAAEFLQKAAPVEASADYIEGHFLNLLHRGLPPNAALPGELLTSALAARQAAEQAALPNDRRVHYAIESLVSAADERRRQGEDGVFLQADGADRSPLGPALYEEAMARSRQMMNFLRLRDEVWADLPRLAEWRLTQSLLVGQLPAAAEMEDIIQRTIALDAAIEDVMRAREESSTFAAPIERCEQIFTDLETNWRSMIQRLADAYEEPTRRQGRYTRPDDLRNVEITLRQAPLVSDLDQMVERYAATLAQRPSTGESSVPAKSAQPGKADKLFAELQKVLDYEFVNPYEQHQESSLWGANSADVVFRSADRARPAAWQRVKDLFDEYTKGIANEPLVWNKDKPAYAASARLRQWDRRIRVASPWLSSFHTSLRPSGQFHAALGRQNPTRWLQEYDAAHVAAWHAHRALYDFWGNGEAKATGGVPFFASAVSRCDSALPDRLRPIGYDPPGGKFVDFSYQGSANLQALRAWDPIEFPRLFNISSGSAGDERLDVAVTPVSSGGPWLPPGKGALVVGGSESSGSAPRVAFDSQGNRRVETVELPGVGPRPFTATAYIERPMTSPPSGSEPRFEARLWYRGHVKAKPCPIGRPGDYIEYAFDRPKYAAPTVEVRGKDTIRGAVLFVFDCSASMQMGGFVAAQRALIQVLEHLDRVAGNSLKVGLMVYGTQTDIGQPRAMWRVDPNQDVKTLVSIADGNAKSVLQAIRGLGVANCVGTTPLYYSTTAAVNTLMKEAQNQPARRVVVISDGVNMPYETGRDPAMGYRLLPDGVLRNDTDYQSVRAALNRNAEQVQVTLQLFGGGNTRFEAEQIQALVQLDNEHTNFELRQVAAFQLANSILDSFPKTQVELRAAQGSTAPQALVFNQSQPVRDWDATGFLRREYLRRDLRLTLPGEERFVEKPLELLGGERVTLDYDAVGGRLTFVDDELKSRGSGAVVPPRSADKERLLFDALDPEKVGGTPRKLRFRLREEDWSAKFARRPKHIWLEMSPRGAAGDGQAKLFPCLDAVWIDSVNLPRLEAPVEQWPDAPSALATVYFRYDDPVASEKVRLSRDAGSQTVTIERENWRIENVVGEADAGRKIVVLWKPREPSGGMEKLLQQAVWVSPAPDHTVRRYAVDGSEVMHEFTFTQPELVKSDIDVIVVSRDKFMQGAYSAKLEFDVAN